jgi:hypothetical protein
MDIDMKKIILTFAVAAAIMSCQKDSVNTNDPQPDEIRFDMSIPATKATASHFETGDQVAVYAVEYNGEDAPELQIAGNYINNEKLTYNGTSWLSNRTLYWSTKPCDFYALYPYQNLTSVDEHHISIVTDQNTEETSDALGGYEASDFLWAEAKKVSYSDGSVSMKFKHLMSKCVVEVVKGDSFEGDIPDDIVCHIYNTVTSAKLNFADGSVEKDAMGERKTITMKKVNNERFEAVVVPQNIERSTPLIELTMGGIAYLLEYSLSFKPGYVHTITIVLNTSPDQEKIEISINAGTGNWN